MLNLDLNVEINICTSEYIGNEGKKMKFFSLLLFNFFCFKTYLVHTIMNNAFLLQKNIHNIEMYNTHPNQEACS